MRFSCGGKIFIVGEYACLEGGPSILGTVAPEFALDVIAEDSKELYPLPFADASPAGLYLSAYRETLRGVRFIWNDPYDTPIGVGSSSAQFIFSVAAVARLEKRELPSAQELLKIYWDTVGSSQGLRPSGADVLAQWLGGPVIVRNSPYTHRHLSAWKGDCTFILAYTGKKAKTHEHLKKLGARGFPEVFRDVLDRLNNITLESIAAWEIGNGKLLGSALNAYQSALAHGDLAPTEFNTQLEAIQQWPGVLGCKGTGAQGGDCVLLLVEDQSISNIIAQIKKIGWQPHVAQWTKDGLREL